MSAAGRTTARSTAELAELARAGRQIALDTEFVSERRYRPLLCLVQVAVPDPRRPGGSLTEVLDPLDPAAPFDPRPLATVLADPGIEVVLHAGRQDVPLLRRAFDTELQGIFDTQVAAGFVGLPAGAGYADLVSRVLAVTPAGSEALTRWDERPLSEEQLGYARGDVEHLLQLADAIADRLRSAGRLEWALEECRPLGEVTDDRDPDRLLERLPRVARLSAPQRAVARELLVWREREAEALDRPAPRVLPDASLVEVARRAPTDREALAAIRGLPEAALHRRHRGILEAVGRGREAAPIPRASDRGDRSPLDAPLISMAQALVRHRAVEGGLAAELLATQGELAAIVAGVRRGGAEPAERPLAGWRREVLGAELLELLRGRRSLAVGAGGRIHVGDAGPG